MGHPRKARKKYDTPSHPWNADRIKEENHLSNKYGLKNKKEIWKADSRVEKYRREARIILGMDLEDRKEEEEELLDHLVRYGFISPNAKLEEVLDLSVEDILRRRLQTLVYRKGFARTPKEARLFIVHGHITLNGRKIDVPGHFVRKIDENNIDYYPGSSVAEQFDIEPVEETEEIEEIEEVEITDEEPDEDL